MIFERLSSGENRQYTVDGFYKGIDTADDKYDKNGYALSDADNMWSEGKLLKTRDGIYTYTGCRICNDTNCAVSFYSVGDSIKMNNMSLKLGLVKIVYETKIVIKLMIVPSEGYSRCVVIHTCNKSDYSSAYCDVNCLIFNDKRSKGCGVYALVGIMNSSDTLADRYIYELDEYLESFESVHLDQIYTPLVLANGKGNKYSQVEEIDKTYPVPSKVEDINLLSGGFYASYKTDGLSDSFMLPQYPLSSQKGRNIEIIFTDENGDEHRFTIVYSSQSSGAVTIDGVSVVAKVNRTTGKIYFIKSGLAYALPMVEGAYNNLLIKAYAIESDDRLFFMKRFENFGSHTFIYGSDNEPNMIYWSHGEKTLYFPQKCCGAVGYGFQSITAAAKQNNLLILFKPHEIYYISGVTKSDYDIDDILLGNVKKLNVKQSINVAQLNGGTGCSYPDTIKLCANRLVFLGSDEHIYALTSTAMSQKQIYIISRQIDSILKDADKTNAFAVRYKGRYMIVLGQTVLLFDYNTKSFHNISDNLEQGSRNALCWYKWNLPDTGDEAFCGYEFNDSTVIIGKSGGNGSICSVFCHKLGGDCDSYQNSSIITNSEIESGFLSRIIDFDYDGYKHINRVTLCFGGVVSASQIRLEYLTDRGNISTKLKYVDKNKLDSSVCDMPNIRKIRKMRLRVTADKPFSLDRIIVDYSCMS